MEFAQELQSNLRSSPRGREYSMQLGKNKPGLSWKAKYGYVYLDGFKVDSTFDGMNEKGLTFEYLYLPGVTQYQAVIAGKESQSLPYISFGDWVLSNFSSIDEVKSGLENIRVVEAPIPELGNTVLPAHAAIYDAKGNGIVVEFYDDKINVYDNMGVMTNSPKYDWHVTNVSNYINLSTENPKPELVNGYSFSAFGQGSGAIGLPGDASPPSRFVKMAFMVKNVVKAKDANESLNLAQHIINNVDLPRGYVAEKGKGKTLYDTTQWVVFKDITHRTIYYRTYQDLTLRSIAMDKLDLSENGPRLKMPLTNKRTVVNETEAFLKTKA